MSPPISMVSASSTSRTLAAPVLRGALKTPGQAKNVAIFGTKALVADHVSGIDAIDVSCRQNPRSPVRSSSTGSPRMWSSEARSRMRSISQPAFPSSTSRNQAPSSRSPRSRLPNPIPLRAQLAVSDDASKAGARVALVLGGGPIQIFALSSGQAPVLATTFRTPGNAQRASIRGTRAYVADGPAGLQVLDFSTPSQPTIVGSYKTAMPARDVAVAGSLVFVVTGGEEVVILRQTP